MFNRLASILTPLLLLGVALERRTFIAPADAAPYHEAARAAIALIPRQAGPWIGADADVPEPAQRLLRPNAILARRFTRTDPPASASLVVVQCRDTRDLIGHYPPVCYPAHGWIAGGVDDLDLLVDGDATPVRRYVFTRSSWGRESRLVVYSFFVIPGQGRERGMDAVGRAAADYSRRHFGAAQVQVVFADPPAELDELEGSSALFGAAADAVRVIERGWGGGGR